MLTDEALKTIDTNGRRIFLSGEFGVTGITSDELHLCHHRMGTNPLEIIDGSNDKKVSITILVLICSLSKALGLR